MEKQNALIPISEDNGHSCVDKTKVLFLSAPDLKFEYYPEKQVSSFVISHVKQ